MAGLMHIFQLIAINMNRHLNKPLAKLFITSKKLLYSIKLNITPVFTFF